MTEIKSHAQAARIFRETFGRDAQISYERLLSIVGPYWTDKMIFASTVTKVGGTNLYELSFQHRYNKGV